VAVGIESFNLLSIEVVSDNDYIITFNGLFIDFAMKDIDFHIRIEFL